jgi:hypothetical protein
MVWFTAFFIFFFLELGMSEENKVKSDSVFGTEKEEETVAETKPKTRRGRRKSKSTVKEEPSPTEKSTSEVKPEVTDKVKEEKPDHYSIEGLSTFFNDDICSKYPIINSIKERMSRFCTTATSNSSVDLSKSSNALNEIISALGRMKDNEFILSIKGIADFIGDELDNYKEDSIFSDHRAARPFRNDRNNAILFIGIIKRVGPKSTRKTAVTTINKKALGKLFDQNRIGLFVKVMSE